MDRRLVAGQRLKKCGTCDKPMVFARTPNGKLMPVDVDSHDDGNVFAHRDAHGVLVVRVQSEDNPTPAKFETRTVHHRVVCAEVQEELPVNVIPITRKRKDWVKP